MSDQESPLQRVSLLLILGVFHDVQHKDILDSSPAPPTPARRIQAWDERPTGLRNHCRKDDEYSEEDAGLARPLSGRVRSHSEALFSILSVGRSVALLGRDLKI